MIEKVFMNKFNYSQKRIQSKCVFQLLECCISIQTVPFNRIMNVDCDQKSILSYNSVEETAKSFSKGPFLSYFRYFSILIQIIHKMSDINCFPLFLIQGSLIKTYAAMHSYFSTSTFVKLVLLINFYFSGTLLHYPIFLLPLDEFIANNKQTQVICITSQ